MQRKRHQRKLTAWLALAAVLLMSLMPTLSQTFQSKASSDWIELCSAVGSKWVNVTTGAQAGLDASVPEPSPAHVFEHCPYCALHGHDLGPVATADVPALLALAFETPHLFLAAPRTLHAWLAAQPRGPPALS